MQDTETKPKTREFVNPEQVLAAVPVQPGMVVADFGCGSGHFAVAAADMAGRKGQVHAYDVLEEALSQTATLARLKGLQNVSTHQCDMEKFGACDLSELTADLVVISGLLHQLTNRDNAIREAYRALKTGGRILIVEWKKDSPLGPNVSDRVDSADVKILLEKHGLRPVAELPAGAFHYALVYSK